MQTGDDVGLLNKIVNEFVDIVEWTGDPEQLLTWRFPRYLNEIKQGSRLIVRPGQQAIFVTQGKLADVFEPGSYRLTTGDLPVLSTLAGFKYGFESRLKSEVYFVATRQVTGLKWGTPNPVMVRDRELGKTRLRAFGQFTLQVVEPRTLLRQIVGTSSVIGSNDVLDLIRSTIASSVADLLATSNLAAFDFAAHYSDLANQLRVTVVSRIRAAYGLDLPLLVIENISVPEEVEQILDARTAITAVGDLGQFQQFQAGRAILAAAQNPNGMVGVGLGLGAGFALAGSTVQRPNGNGLIPTPPVVSPGEVWYFVNGGQTQGPIPLLQISQSIASGQVVSDTLVWTSGMESWRPAKEVAQLAIYFRNTPPPLPPNPGT